MVPRYILSLDQGTTSSRAIVCDEKAQVVSLAQRGGWKRHSATRPAWCWMPIFPAPR